MEADPDSAAGPVAKAGWVPASSPAAWDAGAGALDAAADLGDERAAWDAAEAEAGAAAGADASSSRAGHTKGALHSSVPNNRRG